MAHRHTSADDWRWAAALALALAPTLFAYPLLLGIPLLDPDEGLHAAIAQEMVRQGEWLIPSLLGEAFLDKPILYFWAEALSLRLLGMNEAAVRLPGLMFGLLAAVTTGLVGGRLLGRAVGLVAGLCYATTILPTALAQAAAHDVALVPWVNLALLGYWEAERAATRPATLAWTLAVGLMLGLSILTKGLVGVAVVGVVYAIYLLLARRFTVAVCFRGAATLVVAGLVASGWYLAVEARQPGYLHYYLFERHVLGFATATQIHGGQPWWYYLPVLAGGGLPWFAYLPAVILDGWTRRRQHSHSERSEESPRIGEILRCAQDDSRGPRVDSRGPRDDARAAMILLWSWLIGGTLLLSLAHSKLVTYLWPMFPPVAILAAVAWVRFVEGQLARPGRLSMAQTIWVSCLTGPVVLPVVMLVVQHEFDMQFTRSVWAVGLAAALAAPIPLAFWISGRPRATLVAAILSTVAQFVVIMTFVLPPVAENLSARCLAEHFNRLGLLPPRLVVVDERIGSILFYLDPALRPQVERGQIERLDLDRADLLQSAPPGTLVAIADAKVEEFGRGLGLSGLDFQRAGRYRLYSAATLEGRRAGGR